MYAVEVILYVIAGAVAGIVRLIITKKGVIPLPKIVEQQGSKYLNLGFIAPLIIGGFAGWIAPKVLEVNTVIAAIAGWAGADFLENLIERLLKLPKRE